MSEELFENYKELIQEKQLLLTELEKKSISVLRQKLSNEGKENSDNKQVKRRRISKIAARDNIRIIGLSGTLGANLIGLGEQITVNNSKSKYFSYLSRNCVLDMSVKTKDSQIDLLGGNNISNFLKNYKYSPVSVNSSMTLHKVCEKITGSITAKEAYNFTLAELKKDDINIQASIYEYILKQHGFTSFIFSDNYIKACSEQSLIVKYWGYIFETFFGGTKDIFIQWGDTVSATCRSANLNMKLDIRIVMEVEEGKIDSFNGEFTKQTACTVSKYYADKAKSTLVGKAHLNDLITSTKHLPAHIIPTLQYPIIQIMGLNCHLFSLSLIDKNLYLLQKIKSMSYPKTFHELRSGKIKHLIEGLNITKTMMMTMKEIQEDYGRDTSDKISKIDKKDKEKLNDNKDWISDVFWDETWLYDDNNKNNDSEEAESSEAGDSEEAEAEYNEEVEDSDEAEAEEEDYPL